MHYSHLSPDVSKFPEANKILKKSVWKSDKLAHHTAKWEDAVTTITAGIFVLRQTAILMTLFFILVALQGTTMASDKNKDDILGREGLLLLLLLRNAQLSVSR